MSINATPGASADSFVSIATADDYFLGRMYSSLWEDADIYTRERALKTATRMLDAMDWVGFKVDNDNSLRWPRSDVTDKEGYALDFSTIPLFLEQATAELALDLLEADASKTDSQSMALLKKAKLGALEAEWAVPDVADKATIQSDVRTIISFYLDTKANQLLRA